MRNIIEQYDRIIEIIANDCNYNEHHDSLSNIIDNFYKANKQELDFEKKMIVKALYLVAKEKLAMRYEGLEQKTD
jgi:hypothetical protein